MIKTDIELLEKNRDDARSMSLALEAQIDLTQGKILSMIRTDQQEERQKREAMVAGIKNEKRGHDMMVEQFDRMIEEAKKHAHVRGSDEPKL